ncbi:MAG: tetratricopeptide repeat protein [Treponema sp.]|jgi:outer membrane protein assembly factor BamD (BamD/ComL family)|nr:tetratricopeptide repeat protein [Treponema sp.]
MKHAIFTQKLNLFFLLAAVLSSTVIFACKSAPVQIPADKTAAELIQDGQDAYTAGNYEAALQYYQAVIDRFGTDTAIYVEARYEIAHLYMKKEEYRKAEPILNEIKEIFYTTQPGILPAAYDKLAEIELAKIPASEKTESTPAASSPADTESAGN